MRASKVSSHRSFLPLQSVASATPREWAWPRARPMRLRLGRGGKINGRVVDDLGAPVDGAVISLPDISPWPDPMRAAAIVGRTAPDGSYQIERVCSLPRLITAREDGSFFAAGMTQVMVEATRDGSVARLPCPVLALEEVIGPTLVLPRPPSFTGRVLDERQRPIAEVLVSIHPRRALLAQVNLHVVDPTAVAAGLADLPGFARFSLLEGEALSGPDGSFTLTGTPRRQAALIATADGRLQEDALGEWIPGETSSGLEFVLAEREVLRLRLFDAEGVAILGPAPSAAEPERALRVIPVESTQQSAWTGSKVELCAELADGRVLRVLSAPLGDGTFAFALPTQLAAIERFSILAPGYKPLVREVRGRLRFESAVGNERLERLDTLEFDLQVSGVFDDSPGSEPQELLLRFCSLPPQTVVSDPNQVRAVCCGFGISVMTTLSLREQRISVPLLTDKPLWIQARTWRGRRAEDFVLGPFAAGSTRHLLEIPALAPGPSPFDAPVSRVGRRDPLEGLDVVSASLCAFDAVTGAALTGAQVWAVCDPTGSASLEARTWTANEDGCIALEGLVAGPWRFVVAAKGHASLAVGPFELSATDALASEIDLGEVQLAPVH